MLQLTDKQKTVLRLLFHASARSRTTPVLSNLLYPQSMRVRRVMPQTYCLPTGRVLTNLKKKRLVKDGYLDTGWMRGKPQWRRYWSLTAEGLRVTKQLIAEE